jgi:HK97 gp10 family phage protein
VGSWEEAIKALNTVAVELETYGPVAAGKIDKIVVKTAHDIESYAKQIAVVDTGQMRSSIGVDIERSGSGAYYTRAVIGPTVSYAPFVEFGTSRMAPRAFMGPALDRYSGVFVSALDAVVDPLAGRP